MAELELYLITQFRVFGVFRGSLFIREDSRYSWSVFLGSGSAGLGDSWFFPIGTTNEHEFTRMKLVS